MIKFLDVWIVILLGTCSSHLEAESTSIMKRLHDLICTVIWHLSFPWPLLVANKRKIPSERFRHDSSLALGTDWSMLDISGSLYVVVFWELSRHGWLFCLSMSYKYSSPALIPKDEEAEVERKRQSSPLNQQKKLREALVLHGTCQSRLTQEDSSSSHR